MKLYHSESWELMQRRWGKLIKDFWPNADVYDISKIPDIFDCIKYDLQHNMKILRFNEAEELHAIAKAMADIVIPQVSLSLFICVVTLSSLSTRKGNLIGSNSQQLSQPDLQGPNWNNGKRWSLPYSTKRAWADAPRPWTCRWRSSNVCDPWPVRRQAYDYLPRRKASPLIGWYQIILLGTCVNNLQFEVALESR